MVSMAPLADAQTRQVSDPRNDVRRYDSSTDETTIGSYKYDFVGIRVKHNQSNVRIDVEWKRPTPWPVIYLDLDNDNIPDYYVQRGALYTTWGHLLSCGTTDWVIDTTYTVKVPRSCLHSPQSVRAYAYFYSSGGPISWTDRTRWTRAARVG